MRSTFILLLFILAACNGRKEATSTAAAEQEQAAIPKKADPSGVLYFTGTLNQKIPVFLWLRMNDRDSILDGAVIYTAGKSKAPIRLLGSLGGENRVVMEYLADGQVSGMWAGSITEQGFKGVWSAPGTEKEYPFQLDRVDTVLSSIPDLKVSGDITGSYVYNYPKEGAMGNLNARVLDASHLICNIDANIGAPSYNMATTGEDTLALQGNTASHYSKDEFGECRYRIRFFRDFAVIDYPTGAYECGFGHNASVEGLFLKTGNTYQASAEEGR